MCILIDYRERETERERERERKGEARERETSIACLWHMPQAGTEPAAQGCALTRNRTHNIPVHAPTNRAAQARLKTLSV